METILVAPRLGPFSRLFAFLVILGSAILVQSERIAKREQFEPFCARALVAPRTVTTTSILTLTSSTTTQTDTTTTTTAISGTSTTTTSTTTTSTESTTTYTTTTTSLPGTTVTTIVTSATDVPVNPGPAQRRKRHLELEVRDIRIVSDVFPDAPNELRHLEMERALEICKRANIAPRTPTCTISPARVTPASLNCGIHGTLRNPSVISQRKYRNGENAFTKCRDSCLAEPSCISFEFNQSTYMCKLFDKTLDQMGIQNPNDNNSVVRYNYRCFRKKCSTTITLTAFATATEHTTQVDSTNVPETTTTTTDITTTTTTDISTSTSTTTTTGPSTTEILPGPTLTYSYSLATGPGSSCLYTEYIMQTDVSNDPTNNYQTGVRQCESYCTQNTACQFFFYIRFNINQGAGSDGAQCYIDAQPYQPGKLQCSYPILYYVGYNKILPPEIS